MVFLGFHDFFYVYLIVQILNKFIPKIFLGTAF